MKIIVSLVLTILLAAPSLAEILVYVNGTILDGAMSVLVGSDGSGPSRV